VEGGGLFAVYPSSHHLSPKVRVFVDFLQEQISSSFRALPATGKAPRSGRRSSSS
jgi:hypothetical protein